MVPAHSRLVCHKNLCAFFRSYTDDAIAMAVIAAPGRGRGRQASWLPSRPLVGALLFVAGVLLGMRVEQLKDRGSSPAAAAGCAPNEAGASDAAALPGADPQRRQQQHANEAAQQQAPAAEPLPPPRRWAADGYELPPECEKHAELFPPIYDYLRPWFLRGITKEDMDACAPVAPAGHNLSEGTPQQKDNLSFRFRLLSQGNEIYVTSGGLVRPPNGEQVAAYYHMITEIQRAAQRFGLPNVEFGIAFGDCPPAHLEEGATGFPTAMCPLLALSTMATFLSIPVPSGEFIRTDYDEWVQRMLSDSNSTKWEEQDERAIGRWSFFPTLLSGHRDRFGHEEFDSRKKYSELSKASNHTFTSLLDGTEAGLPLSKQRNFKYTFSTDGFGTSGRLPKVLATGQVVIKEDSELLDFFYPAMRPWVHYVPTGFNGWEEVDRIVHFLRQHDNLARAIAANGQRFAATHLVSEGRHCYIKVLFEELAKLRRYPAPTTQDFPTIISFADELRLYVPDDHLSTSTPEA